MPDRDWYTLNVARNWRGAARRVEEGTSLPRVGDLALRALARTLRETGGVPGLDDFAGIVREYAAGRKTILEAFSALRQANLLAGGSQLTQFAKQAAESTIMAIDRHEAKGDPTHEIRCRFIECAFEGLLFGPARWRWIPSRFGTYKEAHDWQLQCVAFMAPRIGKLAQALVRHPSGAGLRAPSRVSPQERTADLLYQPVA